MDKKQGLDRLEFNRGLYDVQLVSSYILSSSANNNLAMDLDRSQYILYYLQAKYLYKNNSLLFNENILAGEKGPFVKSSYEWLKKEVYNINKTIEFTFIGYLDDWIKKEDRDFIDNVIKTFQNLSTRELSEKTRAENPWKISYEKDKENPILNGIIYEYFNKDIKNSSRLYGVYDDLEETDLVNLLFQDPKTYHFDAPFLKQSFESYVDNTFNAVGLENKDYNSINDVLGYLADFLIYKEKSVTLEALQAYLYFIQKSFLKLLNKACFNEFIYKSLESVVVGELPELYKIDMMEIDEELAKEREYDHHKVERAYVREIIRKDLLEKKANKYVKYKFKRNELEVLDIILNKLVTYSDYHILNLLQAEKAWINTNSNEVITLASIYKS